MSYGRTYRSIALGLASIFLIFNVGLPIVVASCPMTKGEGRSLCTSCYPVNNAHSRVIIKKYHDTSCCLTVLAADRNRTEFLPTLDHVNDLGNIQVLVVIGHVCPEIITHLSAQLSAPADSPPGTQDIPIHTSALLI